LLAPRPTPKLEDHPLSVRDCLFSIFAAVLHIGGRSSIRNLRTRHAVVTGIHLSHGFRNTLSSKLHAAVMQNRMPSNAKAPKGGSQWQGSHTPLPLFRQQAIRFTQIYKTPVLVFVVVSEDTCLNSLGGTTRAGYAVSDFGRWPARRRGLCLTTHNTTDIPPAAFEPAIPAGERLQTHALDRAATGSGDIRRPI